MVKKRIKWLKKGCKMIDKWGKKRDTKVRNEKV